MNESVFISCVSQEFGTTRGLVSNTLRRLGFTPIDQEIFGTESGDLCQVLREKIDRCEGLIHLVGHGYGAEPPVETEFGRVSYTQYEFLYARSRNKKTWLVIVNESCPRDTPINELDLPTEVNHSNPRGHQEERRRLQQAYRAEREADGHLFHRVDSKEQLQVKLNELRDELDTLREEQRQLQKKIERQLAQIAKSQKRQEAKQEDPKPVSMPRPWLAKLPNEVLPEPKLEETPSKSPKTAHWSRGVGMALGLLVLFAAALFAGFWQMRFGFLARDIEAIKQGFLLEFVVLGAVVGCLVNLVVRMVVPPFRADDLVFAMPLGALLGWGANLYTSSLLPEEPGAFAAQSHAALATLGLSSLAPAATGPVPRGTLLRSVEIDWKAGYYIDGQGVLHWPSYLHPRGWGSIDLRDRSATAAHESSFIGPTTVIVGTPVPSTSSSVRERLGMTVFAVDFEDKQGADRLVAALKAASPELPVEFRSRPVYSRMTEFRDFCSILLLAPLLILVVAWYLRLRRRYAAKSNRNVNTDAKSTDKASSQSTSPKDI